MKLLIKSFLLIILSAFIFTACEKKEDQTMEDKGVVIENNKTDNDTIVQYHFWTYSRDYTYEDRGLFEKDVKEARAKLDDEIARLEAKGKNATGETKEWYDKRIDELKDERDDLDEWKDFKASTKEGWEDFKSGVKNTWKDIEKSWAETKEEMKD